MRNHKSFSPPADGISTESLINLTPLIDVVFVVLISFILIAPFLKMDTIFLAPGIKNHSAPTASPVFTLTIRGDDSLWINDRPIYLANLQQTLFEIKKQNPTSTPRLIPDANSHFITYQRVKNVLENVGYSEMQILLKEPD